MTESPNEHRPVGSYERARNLLLEHIDEETFYDFIHGHEIVIEGKCDKYVLRQINDTNITVSNIESVEEYLRNKKSNKIGKINALDTSKLYDSVVSFIVNAKHRKIDWNCGTFHVNLPTQTPSPPKNVENNYKPYLEKITREATVQRRLKPRFDVNQYTMKRLIESQLTPPYTTRFYEDEDGFYNPVFFIETRSFYVITKKHAQINLNCFNIDAHAWTEEGRFLCNKILPHIRKNTNFQVGNIVN